jgi:hypothetical protein
VQFPDDENGAVLRRMAASGFDFSQAHDVDFYAVFEERAEAALVARQVIEADRSENSLAGVSTGATQDRRTELKVVRKMLVTHGSVTAYERRLGEMCAAHGGQLVGWGVIQAAALDESSPEAGRGRLRNRLDSPGDALDEAELNFVKGIATHGWMQTHALDEDDKPGFSFTTGFQASIGHPEIICFKIDRKVANEIFWLLYHCARNGKPVPRGVRTAGVLPNDDAYVFPVAKRHFAAYFGWSRWFYRGDDFECLQIVWPDEAGVFPWEEGFDVKYANAQIDLTEEGWAAAAAGASRD